MTEVPVKVEKMIFCPISRLQVKLINELRDYVTSEVGHSEIVIYVCMYVCTALKLSNVSISSNLLLIYHTCIYTHIYICMHVYTRVNDRNKLYNMPKVVDLKWINFVVMETTSQLVM